MKPNLRLKREREQRGWSQNRVAGAIGGDLQSVSRWERGITTPSPYFREKLCELFEKGAAELGLLQTPLEEIDVSTSYLNTTPYLLPTHPTPQSIFDPAIPGPSIGTRALIGRETLLRQLKQRLLGGQRASLTLLRGLPGIGKTTLATTIANDPDIAAHFHDGILWAGLGPTPDLLAHLSRWGTLLDRTMQTPEKLNSPIEWARLLHTSIGQRQMLFILDDVWEVATAMALTVGGSHSAHLITTRVPQVAHHFATDEVWTVPPLNEWESMKLLEYFVPELVQKDAQALQELIQAVGGLPLALTLIGRYLRTRASTGQPRRLHTALQQMGDANVRLRISEPRPPIDQQPYLPLGASISLFAVIAVSEQQISQQAHQALRALSVFPARPNNFSEEAALTICQVPVEILDELSDAGLLESPEPFRYQLHQTIADYACIQLGEAHAIRERFVRWMVAYVEKHTSDHNALEQERRNIIAALKEAHQLGMLAEYTHGILAFAAFLEIRGLYALVHEHLQRAYDFARTTADQGTMLAILVHLGQSARMQNRDQEAEDYLREGLALARQPGNRKMEQHFLINLAEVLEQRGDYRQAGNCLSQGLMLARYLRDDERALYHRLPVNYSEDSMCVHFTEPQDMVRRGYLAPIDDHFAGWKYGKMLAPELMQMVTGPDGHIYGVPVDAYVLCLAYNRRRFREAGLDPDQPPRTWEEFRTVARQITDPRRELYGFAPETIYHQGGWHFTNWLYTAGGQGQVYRDGRWYASFNDEKSIQVLQMLRDMRFQDGSIPRQVLLSDVETVDLFARGQVAMIVTAPYVITDFYRKKDFEFNDIGLAPMPQNGGNAALMGGTAHVFNAHSSPQAIQAAFERITRENFADDYEQTVQAAAQLGQAIGIPHISIFNDKLKKEHEEIRSRYVNVPLENYRALLESELTPRWEPPVETQKYYALLDPIVQAVLTDPEAQVGKLLDEAAREFEGRFLG